jgi:excisionase family DNA binding protein
MSKKEEKENPVMRAEEVRKMLGIGRNTFYEWCRLNLIPHKRIGRLIIVSRKSFNAWLENKDEGGK